MKTSFTSSGSTNTSNLNADQQQSHPTHTKITTRSLVHAFKTLVKRAVRKARWKKLGLKQSPTSPNGEACSGNVGLGESSGKATSLPSGVPVEAASTISQPQPTAANSLPYFRTTTSLDRVRSTRDEPMTSTSPKHADRPQSRPVSPPQSASTTITVEQASQAGNAQPVDLDIQTQAVQCISADGASNSSRSGTAGEAPSSWKTQFKMVIHLPKDGSKTRIATLDTGSRVDVVSKPVADALGMTMEPYDGEVVKPVVGEVKPLGQLNLDWHVMGKGRTYTTKFLVLESEAFDVLLSDETIGKIGFYKVNNEIWYLTKG